MGEGGLKDLRKVGFGAQWAEETPGAGGSRHSWGGEVAGLVS